MSRRQLACWPGLTSDPLAADPTAADGGPRLERAGSAVTAMLCTGVARRRPTSANRRTTSRTTGRRARLLSQRGRDLVIALAMSRPPRGADWPPHRAARAFCNCASALPICRSRLHSGVPLLARDCWLAARIDYLDATRFRSRSPGRCAPVYTSGEKSLTHGTHRRNAKMSGPVADHTPAVAADLAGAGALGDRNAAGSSKMNSQKQPSISAFFPCSTTRDHFCPRPRADKN